ncbi:thioredoxin-like protein [Endogone sp. FLAS-F59071]|nr:thioredoxin-like protein [Endogone sp. FLAS-F59071]|eukprot:RUS21114.1 thioredoxin-like protein [Endogone sp. FLAS-F59071]
MARIKPYLNLNAGLLLHTHQSIVATRYLTTTAPNYLTTTAPNSVYATKNTMSHPLLGQPAPVDFVGKNQKNEDVNLAEVIGQGPVVLFFYPKDESTGCTKESFSDFSFVIPALLPPHSIQVCAFRDQYDVFQKHGATVIGVSSDSAESHERFATNQRLQFQLLADDQGLLRKSFQVPKTLGFLPGRVTYVIDRDGVIRDVFSSQLDFEGHVKKALEVLSTL